MSNTAHLPAAPRPRAGFWRAPFEARVWAESLHHFLSLPLGVLGFSLAITFFAAGVGTVPAFLIGLPILAGLLMFARGWGAMERGRAAGLLGEQVKGPLPVVKRGTGFTGWIKSRLTDQAGWKAWFYMIISLPWGIFSFVVTVVFWAVSVAAVFQPLTQFILNRTLDENNDSPVVLGHSLDSYFWSWLYSAAGIALFFVTPWVIRGMASVDRAMVRALLGPGDLTKQVQHLTVSRGAAVDTAAADLRRIERDLHDGAQARLVALAMDLGLAKEKMTSDPEAAQRMVGEAHAEVKVALQELRDLARGIHPAVLTDRGLDAALSAIAARCTVPVAVDVKMEHRPSGPVESVAYFTVSELLQNVSKHSRATLATVTVRAEKGHMFVVVADNGRGGADVAKGSGIAGLVERVRGVDGTLAVDSPEGGPTTVTVTLPC